MDVEMRHRLAIVFALFITSGCSAGSESSVEFRIAVSSPRIGFSQMTNPASNETIYVDPHDVASSLDIMDVEVVESKGNLEIRVIFTPEASDRIAELHESHRKDKMAIIVNGSLVMVSDITDEFKDGLAVLKSGLSSERTMQIARSMGHT